MSKKMVVNYKHKREIKTAKPGKLPVPVEHFFDSVGQTEFMKALDSSDKPHFKELRKTLLYYGDVRKPISFLSACKKHEISLVEMIDLYRSYQQQEGIFRMMKHVPQVLEDVAIDAKSKVEMCPRCDGKGVVDEDKDDGEGRTCPLCKGQKEVRVAGDKLSRELVFEASGMTGKKAPTVAIQQNFSQPKSIEAAMGNVQKLLEP